MARVTKKLTKTELQNIAYEKLLEIANDPKTSSAVKTQALTQIIKLSETLGEDVTEKAPSKLTEFVDE